MPQLAPQCDFTHPLHRLFVDYPMADGEIIPLDAGQTNYLLNVLRLHHGAAVLTFNGKQGEFVARIVTTSRRSAHFVVEAPTRKQANPSPITYAFAPLKHSRLDYMVQKAVEMGVGVLAPVITRRTQVKRVNIDRMRANAIEAAEQCGILCVPDIRPAEPFDSFIADWPSNFPVIFCDENSSVADPVAAIRLFEMPLRGKIAVFVGPEGGFDPIEREALLKMPNNLPLSLGPRVLRSDTAAVAVLAILQAVVGDWGTNKLA